MATLSNIRFVLSHVNYRNFFLLASILFLALFGWLLGLSELPWLNWIELSNSVVWELFLPNLIFVVLAALMNGLLISLTVFRLRELQTKISGKEAHAGLMGMGLTSVFAACPFCAISVASVFGVSFVSNFIAPFYLWFQLFSLAIVIVALFWTSDKIGKECAACQIQLPAHN